MFPCKFEKYKTSFGKKKRLAWNEKPQMAVICGYFSRQIILFIVLTSKKKKKYRIFLNNLGFVWNMQCQGDKKKCFPIIQFW